MKPFDFTKEDFEPVLDQVWDQVHKRVWDGLFNVVSETGLSRVSKHVFGPVLRQIHLEIKNKISKGD